MPIIPGSALKGLARHYAQQMVAQQNDTTGEAARLARGGAYHEVLFGAAERASYIVYHDAWYVPDCALDDSPLVRDVITVHHPNYYTGSGNKRHPPTDFDDPNPVGFVSARGAFLVAVEGPTEAWSRFARELLQRSLVDYGVGGKTSSGYGRLVSTEEVIRPAPPPREHPMVAQIRAIPKGRFKQEVGSYMQRWQGLEDGGDRLAIARALLVRVDEMRDPKWADSRAWVIELRAYVAGHDA